jgi:hypothetical protein
MISEINYKEGVVRYESCPIMNHQDIGFKISLKRYSSDKSQFRVLTLTLDTCPDTITISDNLLEVLDDGGVPDIFVREQNFNLELCRFLGADPIDEVVLDILRRASLDIYNFIKEC